MVFDVGTLVGIIDGVLVGITGNGVMKGTWSGLDCSFTGDKTGEQETKNIMQINIEILFISLSEKVLA